MEKIRPNALCLFINDQKVLAGKGIDTKTGKVFYRLFGGGIEFGEKSDETIVREMKEELGATATNLSKLEVVENIFEYQGIKNHEITFLYKADFLEKSFYEDRKHYRIDKDIDSYAEWVSISEILSGELILYPELAKNYLK